MHLLVDAERPMFQRVVSTGHTAHLAYGPHGPHDKLGVVFVPISAEVFEVLLGTGLGGNVLLAGISREC